MCSFVHSCITLDPCYINYMKYKTTLNASDIEKLIDLYLTKGGQFESSPFKWAIHKNPNRIEVEQSDY